MDRAYGAAVLTIVAAYPVPTSSLCPCGGLPGYSANWGRTLRQKTREVQGLTLIVPSGCVDDIAQTQMGYQKRDIPGAHPLATNPLFTHVQTYFHCSCNVFVKTLLGKMFIGQPLCIHAQLYGIGNVLTTLVIR